jgi:hypothetical protein
VKLNGCRVVINKGLKPVCIENGLYIATVIDEKREQLFLLQYRFASVGYVFGTARSRGSLNSKRGLLNEKQCKHYEFTISSKRRA